MCDKEDDEIKLISSPTDSFMFYLSEQTYGTTVVKIWEWDGSILRNLQGDTIRVDFVFPYRGN